MPRNKDCPAFLFYPDDFASDGKVEAMTTEEVGAYTLLLCKAWREDPPGSLPNDDRVLSRWARLTPDRWAECKTAVLAPFTLGADSRWHQKRMRAEWERLQASKKRRAAAAKTAAQMRWEYEEYQQDNAIRMRNACESHTNSNANAMRLDAIPIPISSPSPSSREMKELDVEGGVRGGENAPNGAAGSKRKNRVSKPASTECDSEFLAELQANPAYTGLDVQRIYGKMVAWCKVNNKLPTRKRFVNWLNREDKPLNIQPKRKAVLPG